MSSTPLKSRISRILSEMERSQEAIFRPVRASDHR